MHELAAKVDEYARGMIGPLGATLFEELGLYYIGPVDGHNIDDLICVLNEVASLGSTGPVLIHVITEDEKESEDIYKSKKTPEKQGLYYSSHIILLQLHIDLVGMSESPLLLIRLVIIWKNGSIILISTKKIVLAWISFLLVVYPFD